MLSPLRQYINTSGLIYFKWLTISSWRSDVVRHSKSKSIYLKNSVWGEMPPDAIPAIDGYAIIILMDTEIHRGFDAGFLATPHSALKPCA